MFNVQCFLPLLFLFSSSSLFLLFFVFLRVLRAFVSKKPHITLHTQHFRYLVSVQLTITG